MASSFLDSLLADKIARLCSKFSPALNSQSARIPPPYPYPSLVIFTPASSEEIRRTNLVDTDLPVLLVKFLSLVNISLSSRTVNNASHTKPTHQPTKFAQAHNHHTIFDLIIPLPASGRRSSSHPLAMHYCTTSNYPHVDYHPSTLFETLYLIPSVAQTN